MPAAAARGGATCCCLRACCPRTASSDSPSPCAPPAAPMRATTPPSPCARSRSRPSRRRQRTPHERRAAAPATRRARTRTTSRRRWRPTADGGGRHRQLCRRRRRHRRSRRPRPSTTAICGCLRTRSSPAHGTSSRSTCQGGRNASAVVNVSATTAEVLDVSIAYGDSAAASRTLRLGGRAGRAPPSHTSGASRRRRGRRSTPPPSRRSTRCPPPRRLVGRASRLRGAPRRQPVRVRAVRTSDDGRLGYAAVELLMRRLPRDGHFIVNPSEGTVGETVFTLRCGSGWPTIPTTCRSRTRSTRVAGRRRRRAAARALAACRRICCRRRCRTQDHQALRPRESGGRRDDHAHDRGQPPMGANVSTAPSPRRSPTASPAREARSARRSHSATPSAPPPTSPRWSS